MWGLVAAIATKNVVSGLLAGPEEWGNNERAWSPAIRVTVE